MKKILMLQGLLFAPVIAMAYGGHGYGGCLYGPGYFGFGGGLGMWIITLALLVLLAVLAVRTFRNNGSLSLKKDSALDVLRERFARGEITKEQFQEMKKEIG